MLKCYNECFIKKLFSNEAEKNKKIFWILLLTEKENKKKVKLVTEVEGDPKAPFSIATTQKCG